MGVGLYKEYCKYHTDKRLYLWLHTLYLCIYIMLHKCEASLPVHSINAPYRPASTFVAACDIFTSPRCVSLGTQVLRWMVGCPYLALGAMVDR